MSCLQMYLFGLMLEFYFPAVHQRKIQSISKMLNKVR